MSPSPPNSSQIARLLEIMARLREPERGCPWDIEQNFETIAPYTIEEAYEVAEAIRLDDMAALKDELGDLLLQVVFHARMAEEAGHFDFEAVARTISDKMVRRHPHVFGDKGAENAVGVRVTWEQIKAEERLARANDKDEPHSILDGVALSLPALSRAEKLQKRAARVGFDWPEVLQVFDKIDEELAEIKQEIQDVGTPERLEDEVGDLLFAAANLARHLGLDAEGALRRANGKFEQRFRQVEARLGEDLEAASLDEMEAAWQAVKGEER
ncbi:MAG: nucleoside triphosphate pyrophosphohydrolase [Rhodospirillales bacterium]|nr:nucleoside triphosphate pyrophosphohydrolase [Rhodospirillales bacterium]